MADLLLTEKCKLCMRVLGGNEPGLVLPAYDEKKGYSCFKLVCSRCFTRVTSKKFSFDFANCIPGGGYYSYNEDRVWDAFQFRTS